jgi:translation initiation factor 2 beta subunit (eIF-2beta)/eIF-5
VSFRKSLEFETEGNNKAEKDYFRKLKVSNSTLIQNSNSLFNSFNSSLKILPQFYFRKFAASGKFHEKVLVVSRAAVQFSISSGYALMHPVRGDETYWLLQLGFNLLL